jgi:hypothetical protein
MGINRPSFSAIFGKNAALLRKGLELYAVVKAASTRETLVAPTARVVLDPLLSGAVDLHFSLRLLRQTSESPRETQSFVA